MNREMFLKKKELLLELYDAVKESGLLPAVLEINGEKREISEETIEEFKKNLEEEKFTVSICGQIKAGKSTLLNAMIFEDIVLPSSTSPETAKLTILKYAEEPKFIAHFYTEEEWKNLKQGEYKEYIDNFLNEYTKEKGEILIPEEYLGRVDEVNDFSLLKEYVGAKGKYTLFVKYVELFYPSEFLKEITIVDTPGINDPDPERSKITKEWIHNSDAVIFLTYAGRPFDKSDKEFLDEYLFSVPKDKLIIAATKIDNVQDYNKVAEFIKEEAVKSLGEGWSNVLFKDKDVYPLAPVFSLYKRIEEKINNGEIDAESLPEKLIDDIETQLYTRPETDANVKRALEDADKLLEEFKEAVFKHLIDKKGEAILESHQQKILGVYEYHIRNIEEKIAKLKDEKSLILKSNEEIEEEIKNLEIFVRKFTELEEIASILREKSEDDIASIIDNKIKESRENLENEIESAKSEGDINRLIYNLKGHIKKSIEELSKEIIKEINNYINSSFKANILKLYSELDSISKNISSEFLLLKLELFTVDRKGLERTLKELVEKTLFFEDVKEYYFVEVEERFLFFFKTTKIEKRFDLEGTKENIKEKVRKLFDNLTNMFEDQLRSSGAFETYLNEPIENIRKEIRAYTKEYKNKFNDIKSNQEVQKERLEEINSKINALEQEKEVIIQEKEKIENLLKEKLITWKKEEKEWI